MKISPGSTLHFELVLFARDMTKLMELTNDIEYYYSVPCTIVQLNSSNTLSPPPFIAQQFFIIYLYQS